MCALLQPSVSCIRAMSQTAEVAVTQLDRKRAISAAQDAGESNINDRAEAPL